ncbi:hypothetical protein H4J45_09755 [Colwellia sp. BRX10-6]|uniref:hypothetical protein n=1 Tax=unclassified Colwellia TaxID=196834 RepID=UPI0015F3F597|nr:MULTISPECIES: hypothetical protein [unclassified Colwellia]MBA6383658.1 hypothetical protein [Colwellia sp. BRX10-9]MBA6394368.1 hypothetical protein [Colwellia sp. BRX10-6]
MNCDWNILSVCLVKAGSSTSTIFGFSEFLSALALLVIVYTITDVRYKFRIATAPFNLPKASFTIIAIIGIGTLMSEIWVAEKWATVAWNLSQALWQSIFALTFLITVLVWLWFAFIKPPKYGKSNYKRFYKVTYQYVMQAKESEIRMLSDELVNHIPDLVKYANTVNGNDVKSQNCKMSRKAYELIFLLSNKNFCDTLAAYSPHTAIAFFNALESEKTIHANCFNIITSLISTSLLNNKNSLIYHENEHYRSGLLGHNKALSRAMFGNYHIISQVRGNTVLDVDYVSSSKWDNEQISKYCELVLISFRGFVESGYWYCHSSELFRALSTIQGFAAQLHKTDNTRDMYSQVEFKNFDTVVGFANSLTQIIAEQKTPPDCIKLKNSDKLNNQSFYDHIAALYFELIHFSCYISEPMMTCWFIQHNTVWGKLFDNFEKDSKAKKIILHKVRRRLFNSIKEFEKYPNYQSARILGFCINIFSIVHKGHGLALRKAVWSWVDNNYSKLHKQNPKLAKAALMDGIEYDEEKNAIVKVGRGSMGKKPTRTYWKLKD